MQFKTRNIVVATVLAVSAGGVFAQQEQQYGRDSLYVAPGHSASTVSTGTNPARFGRDSAYATQSPGSSTSVATNVPGLQPFGRDSLYAIQLQNPTAQSTETRIGSASPKAPGG